MATQAWETEERRECEINLGFYGYEEDEPLEIALRDFIERQDLPGMYSWFTHYDEFGGVPLYYHSLGFTDWLTAALADIWLQARNH